MFGTMDECFIWLIERKPPFAPLVERTFTLVKITAVCAIFVIAAILSATKNPDALIIMIWGGLRCFTDKLLPVTVDSTDFWGIWGHSLDLLLF
jgi:hypothetical protein